MATYNKFVLTDAGRVLLNKVLAGECEMTITAAATGSGVYEETEDLTKLTALKELRQIFGISSFSREDDKIHIRFVISNFDPATGTGLTEEYRVSEIGIYVQDPEEGEILYAISTANKDRGDFIPVYDEVSPVSVTINTHFIVGNGGNILIRVLSGAYATAADMMELNQKAEDVAKKIEEMRKNCPYKGDEPIVIDGANISHKKSGVTEGEYGEYANKTISHDGTFRIPYISVDEYGHITVAKYIEITLPSETKNTAGSTDTSNKIYIIGAMSQGTNPKTYSQDTAYIGTDGHLYSNSKQVVNLTDEQALWNKTYEGYTLGTACQRNVTSTPTYGDTKLISSGGVYSALNTVKRGNISWNSAANTTIYSAYVYRIGAMAFLELNATWPGTANPWSFAVIPEEFSPKHSIPINLTSNNGVHCYMTINKYSANTNNLILYGTLQSGDGIRIATSYAIGD